MNGRIRELAHEAGLPTYNPEGVPTKLEKFAELIVRECAEYVRHWNYNAINSNMPYGVSSDDILNYFEIGEQNENR